jgi:hypothetical protein
MPDEHLVARIQEMNREHFILLACGLAAFGVVPDVKDAKLLIRISRHRYFYLCDRKKDICAQLNISRRTLNLLLQ